MTPKELSDIRRKLKVLNYAKEMGNAAAACRHFGISDESFYKWQRAYARGGERGLINSKPCPQHPKLRPPAHIEEKILYLRRTSHLGQQPIALNLVRVANWLAEVPLARTRQTAFVRVMTPLVSC